MHILDTTLFWAPASGGVRTYLEAKAAWLNRRGGLRHTLLTPAARRAARAGHLTLPAPPLPFSGGYRFPLRRRPWASAICAARPDLVEAGDPYLPAWAALDAGQRLGVPVVGFYHSDLPRLLGSRAGRWTRTAVAGYVRGLYRHFDRILAPSQAMVEQLRALGLEHAHPQPLGVDLHRFHPRRRSGALRRRLGLEPGTRLLVFAGRAAHEKNIPVLSDAARRLGPAFHVHLIGAGMPSGLPANMSREGHMGKDALARRLADADALVHAGDRETFGLVVLEAMASGLPVVGVAAGAVPELVVPGTGLLAPAPTADDLAEQVRRLFALDWQAMGRQARAHAERHYAWETVLAGLMSHYQALLGSAPLQRAVHG